MRVLVQLNPLSSGGTMLTYEVWARPRTALGLAAIPAQIGILTAKRIDRTVRRYDDLASTQSKPATLSGFRQVRLAPGGQQRLGDIRQRMLDAGENADLLRLLADAIEHADDIDVAQFRPYELADRWGMSRRAVLELCLKATRAGLLEFRWKLLCPLCRGSREGLTTLADVKNRAHCDSCHIDFTVNFDRSVELRFRPNPSIREITADEYCVGGPGITPHIVAQQLLGAGENRTMAIALEPGRYRLRTGSQPGGALLVAESGGPSEAAFALNDEGWPEGELRASTNPIIHIENQTDTEHLFVLERTAWTDQAATAAEVTALQIFRDLFATEALRPGEECSVGSVAIVFTDLRSSTQMYREIGDAVAFSRVLSHFDVVKATIAEEGGAVVKTIGDAVMAVFTRPVAALRAMTRAQAQLAAPHAGTPPLALKAGIHYGPCIAVTLNERLDYFGSTINIAARLEGQSSGADLIISDAVRSDHEVAAWLGDSATGLTTVPLDVPLKGFDQERFRLWRVWRHKAETE